LSAVCCSRPYNLEYGGRCDANDLAVGVEEDPHVELRGINSLQVTVEDILEVIEIVPLSTSGIVVCICLGHADGPSVPFAHGLDNIASCIRKDGLEVVGSNANVRLY
jgi:hypothetical protein